MEVEDGVEDVDDGAEEGAEGFDVEEEDAVEGGDGGGVGGCGHGHSRFDLLVLEVSAMDVYFLVENQIVKPNCTGYHA